MRAIINEGPGQLVMREAPTPAPGPGEVRIRTCACAVCATDLAMIAGWERTAFPSIPGHEWSGRVDAVGPQVSEELRGRLCVGENVLADGGEVGFEHPGGYAEYFVTEADRLHVLPDGFPAVTAALIEPLAVVVRGLRRLGDDRLVSPVLVFGDGPIGLIVLLLLHRNETGRPVTLVGGRRARLELAREFGAVSVLDHRCLGRPLAERLVRETGTRFPTVIEASGAMSAVRAAFDAAAKAGRILVLGDYGAGRADFRWTDLLQREIELVGSNASAEAWPAAVRLALSGDLPLDRLVSHVMPAERFAEGIRMVREGREDVVKVVLTWTS